MHVTHDQPNQAAATSRDVASNTEPEGESTYEGSAEYICPPVITDLMGADQILNIFQSRGVPDLSTNLDLSTIAEHPAAGDGLNDVYRARLLDGSLVAVKSLRVSLCDREDHRTLKHIARELHVWSGCKHGNILELIGTACVHGLVASISPWMENGTVSNFISNNPGAPRYELCAQLAAAVSYLHRVGVVHSNIKGSNVLVSTDLTIKLSSFGSFGSSGAPVPVSYQVELALCSIRWAAPEFFMEDDARPTLFTDVYALGMTILEIISGSIPYREVRSHVRTMCKIMNGIPPKRPEAISKDDTRADVLWPLLLKCWSYDPSKRPAASDVLEMMNALLVVG
ncbi:unnamed protein product [Rhizoctonia solani]|uniref:Protein kinase domain-containing protein n=1 Tax=Rhizoctonia solani TaxID=456999 RepID=A0A8H3B3C1_9AGAM|nr:unnamed protein product [Rhizoctonia solani]